jgi:cobalt-zinc-cadmium efflux system outer membrane protein
MRNSQLEIAREQTAQARARRVTAISVPDPTLEAGFDQLTGPLTLGAAGARPVSLGISVPFPTKFRLNSRIGFADIHASESNYRLQQQTIALQASSTYDSLLVALRHRDILRETRKLANDFLTRTQARYEGGTAARLDVIQARVSVAQADNDLIANEREIATAQASLNRTLGRVIGAAITPVDSLDVPPPLPDSATIEQVALANRPELAIVQNQQQGARATTSLTKQFWLPDLTMSVQRDYAQPGSPQFTTGIAMPLPAFYWQHARGDIAQAQHFERELEATYRDTRAQVTQDVRSAYANASTAIRQVIFLRDELVPAAAEAHRVASTSYALGGSSALEVLTARAALLDAQRQLADALAAANTARADLDRALGATIPTLGASNT